MGTAFFTRVPMTKAHFHLLFIKAHERLLCLFIVCKTMFTIGESQIISHANDTQARQVAPNLRRGRFSTETPLERDQREHRRRRRQQKTAEQRERRLVQRRQRRQQETEEQRNRRLEHQRHYDRCYTVENSHLLVCRFPCRYIDQSLKSFSSVLRREV